VICLRIEFAVVYKDLADSRSQKHTTLTSVRTNRALLGAAKITMFHCGAVKVNVNQRTELKRDTKVSPMKNQSEQRFIFEKKAEQKTKLKSALQVIKSTVV